jgi:hypothetical protein
LRPSGDTLELLEHSVHGNRLVRHLFFSLQFLFPPDDVQGARRAILFVFLPPFHRTWLAGQPLPLHLPQEGEHLVVLIERNLPV